MNASRWFILSGIGEGTQPVPITNTDKLFFYSGQNNTALVDWHNGSKWTHN